LRAKGRISQNNCAAVVWFGFGWQADCVSVTEMNEQLSPPRPPDPLGAWLAVALIVIPWLLIGWLIWILA
jgi:hypothetical protein